MIYDDIKLMTTELIRFFIVVEWQCQSQGRYLHGGEGWRYFQDSDSTGQQKGNNTSGARGATSKIVQYVLSSFESRNISDNFDI